MSSAKYENLVDMFERSVKAFGPRQLFGTKKNGQWGWTTYSETGKQVEAFRAGYAEYGAWIILLKGLTPIPYKLVTITSGFADFNIWLFVVLSVIARGGRFFFVAVLLNRYGDWIRVKIEEHLGLWVSLGAGVLVAGFVIAFRMI